MRSCLLLRALRVAFAVILATGIAMPVSAHAFATYSPSQLCINCARGVSVRVRAANIVFLGGQVTYTIYIRNDDIVPHTVPVRAYLDPSTTYVSASAGGYTDGSMIRWENVRVDARSSVTLAVRVTVDIDASTRTPIVMSAQAAWSSDSAVTTVHDLPYSGNPLRVVGDNVVVRTIRRPSSYQQYSVMPNQVRSYMESTPSTFRHRTGNGLPYSLYMQQGGLYDNNGGFQGRYLPYSCEAYEC